MRIRSTKPEFWRSKTIAAIPWDVRLVLKGLESYVDDNGVGKDDIALIAADVFPRDLSASPRDTLARLSEAISMLAEAGLIVRYEVDREKLVYIDRWKSIQRIDKPGKGRFPRPDGTFNYSENVNRESYAKARESVARAPETIAPGTGEQGNRGTGEIPAAVGNSTTDRASARDLAAALASTAHTPVAHQLVERYAGTCNRRPPTAVLSELAVQVDVLLGENWSPAELEPAIAAWGAKGLHPKTLPSVAHEIANRASDGGRPPSANQTDAYAAQFLAGNGQPPELRALPGGAS